MPRDSQRHDVPDAVGNGDAVDGDGELVVRKGDSRMLHVQREAADEGAPVVLVGEGFSICAICPRSECCKVVVHLLLLGVELVARCGGDSRHDGDGAAAQQTP